MKAMDFVKTNADRRFALLHELVDSISVFNDCVISNYDGAVLFDELGSSYNNIGSGEWASWLLELYDEPNAILVEDLGLSVRTYNVLKRAGMIHLADILTHDEGFYKRGVRNMGLKNLEELKTCLMVRGLSLSPVRIRKYDIACAINDDYDDDIII